MLKVNCFTRFAVCLGAAVGAGLAHAATGGFSVDIQNREAVRTFYNSIYDHRAGVRAEWSGSAASCLPGTTSAAYRDAVLTRLNFYRAMAGVPASVTFDDTYSLKAQAAALIMSANDEISHTPVLGWLCFSLFGAEGADNSNLALGSAGMDAVDAYIMDAGPNYRAGHRRWLIYPKTQVMGTGDIDPPDGSDEQKANSIWIFDDHFLDPRPPTRESFVAWPPPGYVPHPIVFPRWSFQISLADFSSSIVTLTSNDVPIEVGKEKVEVGYGENGIVFVPHGIAPQTRMHWPKPSQDIVYHVNIENVVLFGGTVTNFSYNVIVFDPDQPGTGWAGLLPQGASAPQAQRLNRYSYKTFPKATGYDFRTSTLESHTTVEGAENGSTGVVPWVSGLYPLIQTSVAASGSSAFHLAHSKPPRPQWFMLNEAFVPSAQSELRFQSRLGGATTEQAARVQVSLDEGSSWQDVYEQTGLSIPGATPIPGEAQFTQRVVSLSRFAGRAIWVRFNYGFIFGPVSFARGSEPGIGWYIDDIEVTNAGRLAASTIVFSSHPEFDFVPQLPGAKYYLDARPRFYDEYTGEWSGGLLLSAINPAPMTLAMKTIRNPNQLEVEFAVSSVPAGAALRLEQSSTVNGQWTHAAEIHFGSGEHSGRAVLPKNDAARFYRVVAE